MLTASHLVQLLLNITDAIDVHPVVDYLPTYGLLQIRFLISDLFEHPSVSGLVSDKFPSEP